MNVDDRLPHTPLEADTWSQHGKGATRKQHNGEESKRDYGVKRTMVLKVYILKKDMYRIKMNKFRDTREIGNDNIDEKK